jgi:hypothetical protein
MSDLLAQIDDGLPHRADDVERVGAFDVVCDAGGDGLADPADRLGDEGGQGACRPARDGGRRDRERPRDELAPLLAAPAFRLLAPLLRYFAQLAECAGAGPLVAVLTRAYQDGVWRRTKMVQELRARLREYYGETADPVTGRSRSSLLVLVAGTRS